MSRTERRQDRKRRGEQLRQDLQADPDGGAFTAQFAIRLMTVYVSTAAALIAVIVAVVHAIARRERGARYVLTSKPTVTAAALGTGGYLSGVMLARWTRTRADQIHEQVQAKSR